MSASRLRIAWVSPYLPEPATTGGSIRQQHLARALAELAEVHLFARGDVWERPRLRSPELSMFESRWLGRDYVHLAPSPSWCRSKRVRSGSPRRLYAAIREAHRVRPFDAVVVAHSWAALGAEALGLPWLLDSHNIEARYFAELARARGAVGTRVSREISALAAFETRAWTAANAVTSVSEADAEAIAATRGAPVPVIANGCPFPDRIPPLADRAEGGLLFVGSLGHAPNVDAARRVVGLMPRVWERGPRVSLTIVGGPVPHELEAERAALSPEVRARVILAGIVPSVAPYLKRAAAYVVPMRFGAGSSLKIAEAAAYGLPIVSTELGVRGFGLAPERDYLRAESDAEFVEAIALALVAAEPIAAMGLAARERVRPFAWQTLGARFARGVRELVEASGT